MDTYELLNKSLPNHLKMTPEMILMKCSASYLVSCALYSVIKLEIFKDFENGPRSVFDIAKSKNLNTDFLLRTMRALSSQGIFKIVSVDAGDTVFEHSDASRLLCNPDGIINAVEFSTCPMVFSSFKNFTDTLTNGTPQGPSPVGSYSLLNVVPKVRELMAMYQKSVTISRELAIDVFVDGFDLLKYKFTSFVDIGGEKGYMSKLLLEKYSSLEYGICYDTNSKLAKNPSNRLKEVAGDWAKSIPANEQCYISGLPMHELDDQAVLKLLNNVGMHLATNKSKLFIIGVFISETNDMSFGSVLDLNIMHCIRGGKFRDDNQWKKLIEQAGLQIESREYLQNQIGVFVISKP